MFDTASMLVKPVILPPGLAKLSTSLDSIGSEAEPNTIGMVRVCIAERVHELGALVRIASGDIATSSFA